MINQRINLSPFKWHLAALLGYLLLSIGLTWPIILHWNSGLTGYIEEASRNAWNMWWWRWALEHGVVRPQDQLQIICVTPPLPVPVGWCVTNGATLRATLSDNW